MLEYQDGILYQRSIYQRVQLQSVCIDVGFFVVVVKH